MASPQQAPKIRQGAPTKTNEVRTDNPNPNNLFGCTKAQK
ncbi:hypothetical protein SLEP1_g28643 [Rubroshorea leprosula]|uniref:Uncharacterized protein n=1 Tax=Rubroshorea leprosula TaxID=152421 RepID=A0AAV5K000_9ROSI|nr:hypothetical protein SLEP1_g28643 [Rubroshorea leprosula]